MFLLGGLQVLVTTALLAGICMLVGLGGPASVAIGAALSLSSTAIVLRLLAERREMHFRFGRGALGILMTQDLAVGPLLVLIPALRGTPLEMTQAVGLSILKAVVVTMLILGIGRIVLRPLMNAVAATRSKEIFAALTLLIVLGGGRSHPYRRSVHGVRRLAGRHAAGGHRLPPSGARPRSSRSADCCSACSS